MRISDILTDETLKNEDEEEAFTINMTKKKKKKFGVTSPITSCSSFRSVLSRWIPSLKRSSDSSSRRKLLESLDFVDSEMRVDEKNGFDDMGFNQSVLLDSGSKRDVCNEDHDDGSKVNNSAVSNLPNDSEMANSSGRYMKDDSFSLGLGAGFVFLMVACKNEFNKMLELGSQVEVLVKDVKDEIRRDDVICQPSKSNDAFGFSSTSSPIVGNTKCNPIIQNHMSSHDLVKKEVVVGCDQHIECSQTNKECGHGIDQLEAEFEAELERLQFSLDTEDSLGYSKQREPEMVDENTALVRSHNSSDGDVDDHVEMENTALVRSHDSSDGDVDDPVEMENTVLVGSHSSSDGVVENQVEMDNWEQYGVSPYELERRLHELVEARQQERIKELECALESAKRKLHQKEIEVSLWKNTASLISQHVSDGSCLSR